MLEPLTTLEAGQRRELSLLREENLELKIRNLMLLKEIGELQEKARLIQELTQRIAA